MRIYEEAEKESRREKLKRDIATLGSQVSFFERELEKIKTVDKRERKKATKKND